MMDEKAIVKKINKYDVQAIEITNITEYEQAGCHALNLKDLMKEVQAYWSEPKRKAYEAHKAITEKENEMLKPIKNKLQLLSDKINLYLSEDRRKKSEMERKERERLQKLAEKAAEKGKEEKAQELQERAELVEFKSEVKKTTHTGAGSISTQNDIEIEITDYKELLKQVIAGKLPPTVVDINLPKLKTVIKQFNINNIPGVKISQVVKSIFRGKGNNGY